MHNRNVSPNNLEKNQTTNRLIESFLREARRLHRFAKDGDISHALPVLRRLQSVGLFGELKLSRLYKQRNLIQRKHLLRMLALESGYRSWELFKPALLNSPEKFSSVERYDGRDIAKLNLWFSTIEEAQKYAKTNGGRALVYGQQAVVIPVDSTQEDNTNG